MPAVARSAAEALRPLLAGEAFGQLIRFGVAGIGVTLLSVAIYLTLAESLRLDPMAANVAAHMAGVVAGYAIHSRWSFRAETNDPAAMLRFAIVSGLSFALNTTWVWLATHALHGPAWLAAPAMVLVTPLASFALNRVWVFRQNRTA